MKQIAIISAALILVFAGSCRKEEPATLPKNGVMVEPHCSNGIMDGDEDGVDCGPSCQPCLLSWPIIGTVPSANTFDYIGTSVTFPDANVVSDTTSGALVITATTSGGGVLTITFGSTTPDVFSVYEITTGTPGLNQARMNYVSGTVYTAYTFTDDIHLNRVNGKYSVVFADVNMSYNGGLGSLYTSTDGHINSYN